MRRDRAYDDREAFIRSCNALHSEAGRLVSILERYGTRPATLQERRETSTANKDDCRSCARQEVSAGVRRGEPGFYNPMVGGERMRLCEWCYDWHRAVGRLPSLSELSDHHRGVQVRRPKVAS